MRAGLSTIQQTLTPEASSVLNHSICEAQRRNHGQTTPLHVASSLLASQTGYLRHACIRSHPNSSHPLQCRALELCFSVALDRLPSSQNLSPGFEPPISNALMAALKRAQAHQRRGSPEQQQQPLLAVKVELEQLIVSILDDPSVSRVMREASFSSPAVKAAIEESLNPSNSVNSSAINGLGFRPAPTSNINLYLNPRLKQGNSLQLGQPRIEEVKRIIDIMLKKKKRNPVLVGENEPDAVVMELLKRIEKREVEEELLKNVQVISFDKDFASDRSQISSKMKDLGLLIENRISNNGGSGVVLNLGDLKWLVEQPVNLGISSLNPMKQQIISETGKVMVTEMGKILARFGEESGRLWLIGTATCETYLRCQVYHPSMENEWDLQAVPITARTPVPITARAPVPQLFPRKHEIFGINGNLGNSAQALTPLKSFPTSATTLSRYSSENMDPTRRKSSCSRCMENYEQELQKLKDEIENSTSNAKPEAAQSTFPPWLQIGKLENGNSKATAQSLIKDKELLLKQKTEELQRKCNDTCLNIHPNFHLNLSLERITPISFSTNHQQLQLTRGLGITFQMKQSSSPNSPHEQASSPPRSPVRTDLVLGSAKLHENSPEKTHKDINGCIPSEPQYKFSVLNREKLVTPFDADSFKKLYKGLIEKVGWQPEAASAVAKTVIRCKSGARNRQGTGFKGDTWLLFAGSDRIGKKNMASAMAELIGGSNLITIQLGSQCHENEERDMSFRGKTLLDRIAEAIQRNPFSVILLEDLDQSDMLIQGSIKQAIERGRLADSHGREINLGNVIFILTVNFVPEDPKNLSNSPPSMEEKLASLASNGWQLQLLVSSKSGKHRLDWFSGDNRRTKPRKDSGPALSFDLNQIADNAGDETGDGSRNSSALTSEHEHERNLVNKPLPTKLVFLDFFNFVDGTVVFKPVDFGPLQRKIATSIASTFRFIMGDERLIGVDDGALEKIVAGIWFGQFGLEEWIEKFLIPSFNHLKSTFPPTGSGSDYSGDDNVVIRLVSVRESERRSAGNLPPEKITVVVDRL